MSLREFSINKTDKYPEVHLKPESGEFTIEGRSIPENSVEFYKPMLDWLREYEEAPCKTTQMHFKMDYFNTSSSRILLDIIKILERIHVEQKGEVMIHWHYDQDDPDIMEAGEGYECICDVPFNIIEDQY